MGSRSYDAVVVGAGPGGYVAAIRLAQLGQRTALVEKGSLGGACLNWGCIPSKALIAAANLVDDVRRAATRGVVAAPEVDLARLRAFKNEVVSKLASGIGYLERGNGVEVVEGTATFLSSDAIEVAGKNRTERIRAGAFVVATGARPVELPGFPFGGDVWSAREAVALTEIPRRLVVIGGGVIGLELGTAYAKLGSQVVVLEALPRLMTGVDPDAVRIVAKGLQQRGARVLPGASAKALAGEPGARVVVAEVGGREERIACDKVLVAAGFRPRDGGLGLERLGVRLGPDGFVAVDAECRTSVPSLRAIGDLVGPPFLAHKASRQGEIAAESIAGTPPRGGRTLPASIFTDPEIGEVGLSEDEARAAGHDPLVGKFAFGALGRAIAMDQAEGFVKVIAARGSNVLLGATFCGPAAADLVAEAALAVETGATLRDVARTVHSHPTLPEAFVEACRAALGEAIHAVNRPRRPEAGAARPGTARRPA